MKRSLPTFKAVFPEREPGKRFPIRHCTVFGCKAATKCGKPWCSDHVATHSGESIRIQRELRSIERKQAAGKRHAIVAGDVLVVIGESGTATLDRIARMCQISKEIAERYLIALKNRGVVTLDFNGRGRLYASLKTAKETA